jgi:hypothetical protein
MRRLGWSWSWEKTNHRESPDRLQISHASELLVLLVGHERGRAGFTLHRLGQHLVKWRHPCTSPDLRLSNIPVLTRTFCHPSARFVPTLFHWTDHPRTCLTNHHLLHVTLCGDMAPPVHYRHDSTLGYKESVDNDASPQRQSDRQRDSLSGSLSVSQRPLSDEGNNGAPSSPQSTERIFQDSANAASTSNNDMGPPASTAPRKHRVTLACKRCKRRKQRVRVSEAPNVRRTVV